MGIQNKELFTGRDKSADEMASHWSISSRISFSGTRIQSPEDFDNFETIREFSLGRRIFTGSFSARWPALFKSVGVEQILRVRVTVVTIL